MVPCLFQLRVHVFIHCRGETGRAHGQKKQVLSSRIRDPLRTIGRNKDNVAGDKICRRKTPHFHAPGSLQDQVSLRHLSKAMEICGNPRLYPRTGNRNGLIFC